MAYIIRKLEKKDIEEVARIYKDELPGFLSELGEEFLQLFYKSSLIIPEVFTYIAVDNNKIIGFAQGSEISKGLLFKIIKTNIFAFFLIILKNIIVQPRIFGKIIMILSYPGFKENHPELMSIAISKHSQARGAGKILFETIVKEFKKRKIRLFYISAYERLDSHGFYRKMGCKKYNEFNFLGEKMIYYEYAISRRLSAVGFKK